MGILAVLMVAVGLAAFKSNQRKHIEYAEELGGTVVRDPIISYRYYSFLPRQLHSFIPMKTVGIKFSPNDPKVTDAVIDQILGYFPELINLNLSGNRITDQFMQKVSAHPNLRILHLSGTGVTDEGVEFLSKSRSLIHVYLDRTKISDECIVHLSQMEQLQWLSVATTPLTDKSIETLLQMPKLVYLNVSGTQISKEGKNSLRKIQVLVD